MHLKNTFFALGLLAGSSLLADSWPAYRGPSGDGISTGGQARTPICKMPNIEHTEQDFPVLFLYRKETRDSGGAGKFRGGLSSDTRYTILLSLGTLLWWYKLFSRQSLSCRWRMIQVV